VPVSDEVLQAFQRLAKAQNMSTGRAIAEWLSDTVEAAEFMATTLERARAAPKAVMREMHAYALGLSDETGEMIRKITKKGEDDRAAERASAAPHALTGGQDAIPPPCNTGGKLTKPKKTTKASDLVFPLPPAKVQAYADTNGVPPKGAK
jgi:hypothetical protein